MKKLDYTLAPPEFDDIVLVLQHSAETGKYGRNDWLEGKNWDSESNYSSIRRHLADDRNGVKEDADNGLHPMLMVACRAMMKYTLDKRAKETGKCVSVLHDCREYEEWDGNHSTFAENWVNGFKKARDEWFNHLTELHQKSGQYSMHPQHCECIDCRR